MECWVCQSSVPRNSGGLISNRDVRQLLEDTLSCLPSNRLLEKVCEECFSLYEELCGHHAQLSETQQAIGKVITKLKGRQTEVQTNSIKSSKSKQKVREESKSAKESSKLPVEIKEEVESDEDNVLDSAAQFCEVEGIDDDEACEGFGYMKDEVSDEDSIPLDETTEFIVNQIVSSESEDDEHEAPKSKKSKPTKRRPVFPKKSTLPNPFESIIVENECELCVPKKMFQSTVALSFHYEMDHKDSQKLFLCEKVGCDDEKFLTFKLLEVHKRSHYDYYAEGRVMTGSPSLHRVWCNLCTRGSFFPDELRRHELQDHSKLLQNSCDVCGAKYFNSEVLEVHKLSHSSGSQGFQCSLCPDQWRFEYPDASSLELHLIRMHNFLLKAPGSVKDPSAVPKKRVQKSPITCEKCGKVFPSRKRALYLSHKCLGHSFQCEVCPKTFPFKTPYLIHTISRHESDASQIKSDLSCSRCGKGFATSCMFKRHVNCHNLESRLPFYCATCEERFPTEVSLSSHKKGRHDPSTDSVKVTHHIFCEACGKPFSNTFDFRTHERVEHPHIFAFKCSSCDSTFSKEEFLKIHLKTHQPKGPYLCSLCLPPKEWTCGKELEEHLKIKHTVGKGKTCSHCEMAFPSIYFLTKHLFHKHGVPLPFECSMCCKRFISAAALKTHDSQTHSSEEQRKKLVEGKRAECKVCGKVYSCKSALFTHMRSSHEKSTVQVCEVCGKSLNDAQSMRNHMKIHRQEKNFACDFCDKRFVRGDALRSHRYIHTGEKPYGCYICDKRFNQRTPLKLHIKTHKKDGSWFPESNAASSFQDQQSSNSNSLEATT